MPVNNPSYKIILDADKDAWNWYDACTSTGNHGVDWAELAPADVVASIREKTEPEAYKFIHKYLQKKYVSHAKQIELDTKRIELSYKKNFQKACKKLEQVMGKPLYRNDFTIYLTTFNRAPYNYKQGYLYTCIYSPRPLMVFLHELSHFQFIHYWRNNPKSKVSELSFVEFDWLKESLTMILDEDFLTLIEHIDYGYELHKSYRKELSKFWKTNHNFDELIDYGVSLLPKYKKEIYATH